MKKLIQFVKEESIRVLPATLFFFVAFLLVDATDLVVHARVLGSYTILYCLVSGLIMGKVVLIADLLSLTHRFSHKPLAYVTLWKSFIYVLCSIALRLVEHVVPALFDGKSLHEIYQAILTHAQSPLFWLAQAWLAYLFIIFVACRELITKVGPAKVKSLFFGG